MSGPTTRYAEAVRAGRRRAGMSRSLLLLALTVTVVVACVGSMMLWRLYETSMLASGVPVQAASSASPLVVALGGTPVASGEWMVFARVFAEMQRGLGRPVELRYASGAAESVDLVRAGAVDLALVPSRAYLDPDDRGRLTLVAVPVVEHEVNDAAVLVVRAGFDEHRIEDLRGDRLVFSSDAASGRPFVLWLLRGHGESPETFFASALDAGSAEACLAQLEKGRADAACVRRSALAAWPAGTFAVVEASPDWGMPDVVARRGLDERTIAAVRRSLLSTAVSELLPEGGGISGFRLPGSAEGEEWRRETSATAGSEP